MLGQSKSICIVNPFSGGGKTAKIWPKLQAVLQQKFGKIDCKMTKASKEATLLAKTAAGEGASLIIVVGGDGTTSEVVNGVMQQKDRRPDLALGILPAGTGQDFARTLGIPSDPFTAVDFLAQKKSQPVDIGRLDFLSSSSPSEIESQRYFINIASIGIEGLVDKRLETTPRILGGKLTYLWASLYEGLRYKPSSILVRADGLEMKKSILSIILANGQFFGGGMRVAPTAKIDDGVLDVVIIQHAPFWQLVRDVPRLYNGTIYESKAVEHCTLSSLEALNLGVEPVFLGVDGEAIGKLPVKACVEPRALNILR